LKTREKPRRLRRGSFYFDALLAAQECTKRIRPAGKSRFGSVIERLFGVSNQQFVELYIGMAEFSLSINCFTSFA
jgi:RecB family exonuclease